MGLRFRESKGFLGGLLKVALSKSGPSVSVGGKGVRLSSSKRGQRVTFSLPGTGLSFTKLLRETRGR